MNNDLHSLQTYVSDMLALERHVGAPLEAQAKDEDFSRYTSAGPLVQRMLNVSQMHVDALDRALSRLGGHEASTVKSAVAGFEGLVAGAIDRIRKTKVSKALRDDYTALALCTAAYTMLQTTALALKDEETAKLSEQHLRDYAQCIMSIGHALPETVLQELGETGVSLDPSVAEPARRATEQAWRSGPSASSRSETGLIQETTAQGLPNA